MVYRSSGAAVSPENHHSAESDFLQDVQKYPSVSSSWCFSQWLTTGANRLYLTWGLAILMLMAVTVITVYWFVSVSLS